MNVTLFLVCVLVGNVSTQLVVLNASALKGKPVILIQINVMTEMNAWKKASAKMVNASTLILVSTVFVIQDSSRVRIE